MSKKTSLPNFFSGKSLNFPLYTLCAGLVTITVLAAALTYWLLDRNQRTWTYEYGQALANLSAHRALDSTLNHDLVSLQVILSDVAENTSVINATIHDVENNLLVQAGHRSQTGESNRYANFSAPITLHNSIAGYVTITLDINRQSPFQGQLFWLFGLLTASLIALTLCYAYFSRSKLMEQTQPVSIPILKSPSSLTAGEEGPDDIDITTHNHYHHTHLMLYLQNYQELSQQLNSKSFHGVSRRLEQQLVGVMALYSGKLLHAEQHIIHVQFSSNESPSDAVFKGLCGALLLLQLNRRPTSIPLQLTALLCQGNNSQTLLKRLSYFMAEVEDSRQLLQVLPENTLAVQNLLLDEPQLTDRVITAPVAGADDVVSVTAVQQPYQDLLDKQLRQLSNS